MKIIFPDKKAKGLTYRLLITEASSRFVTDTRHNLNILKDLRPPENIEEYPHLINIHKESIDICQDAITDISNLSFSIADNPAVWAKSFNAVLVLP